MMVNVWEICANAYWIASVGQFSVFSIGKIVNRIHW